MSQLLCNLLKIKFFRDICLKYFEIDEDIYKNIQSDDIFTQYNIEGVGIPDICIKNNKTLIIIENKIRNTTGLQETQKTTYVDYAKSNKGKYILLIPNDDYPQEEIKKIQKENESSGLIKIITWEDFLTHLSKLEIEKCSLIIKESLEYLRDLILEIPEDLTLTNYEVAFMYNPKYIYDVLSLLEKHNKLIEKVSNAVLKELNDKKDEDKFSLGFTHNKGMEYRGQNLKYKNRECIFWGLDLNMREKENGNYTYGLAIEKDSINIKDVASDNKEFPLR